MNDFKENGCWPNARQELLLRACLLSGDEAIAAFETWKTQIDIERLGAGSTRLLPLLRQNLLKNGYDDPLLARCQSVARYTWLQNHLLFSRCSKTLAALHDAQIETMILKGAALSSVHYADFSLRPMNDFDVLVPTKDFSRAVEVLAAQGWKPHAWRNADMFSENYFSYIHAHAFENEQGNFLDLHRHLLPQCCESDADDDFWSGATEVRVLDVPTRALCGADQLLHVCIHGVRWEGGVHPLRWVADAMTILRTSQIDWTRLVKQAKQRHLQLAMHDALSYLIKTLGAEVPNETVETLRNTLASPLQRLEYEAWTRAPETYGPMMKAWLRYRWFARWENHSGKSDLQNFIFYLKHVWKLRSSWHIPSYAWAQGVRQIRAWSRNAASRMKNAK